MTLRVGDAVTTTAGERSGHTRLPQYLRGRTGRIESVHAPCPLADAHAAGRRVDEPLYTVGFSAHELFGAAAEPGCVVHAELWQSYLVRR